MTVYHVIIDGISPEWLELLSWAAQLLLVAIAIGAAGLGIYQLREMSQYRLQRLRIANAQLLMHLDNRWDSKDLKESRLLFNAAHDVIMKKVGSENPIVNDSERKRHIAREWVASLNDQRTSKPADYGKLMSICGFFETVGLMVQKRYVQIDDVFELFLGPLVEIDMCFGQHIAELEKETGMPAGLYKHALNLSPTSGGTCLEDRDVPRD